MKDAQLPHLGHCKMWVQVQEGLPNRVALLRKTGMLITDDQAGLKRWVGRSDFAGVFMCDSDNGNALLRDMENPLHNAFEPERAIPGQRKKCKDALSELVTWVRTNVDKLAKQETTAVTPIDELAKFFPDRDAPESIPGDGEPDIEGRPTFSLKPLKRPKPRDTWDDDGTDGGAGDGDGGRGDQVGDGSGHGSGTGGTGTRDSKPMIELKNVRIVSDDTEPKKKTVHFTPMKGGKIDIMLAIMGDDGSTEKIFIDEGDNGLISVDAKENERKSLVVTLKNIVSDSIAVKAFEKNTQDSGDETITQ